MQKQRPPMMKIPLKLKQQIRYIIEKGRTSNLCTAAKKCLYLTVLPPKARKGYGYILQWTLDHLVNECFNFRRLQTKTMVRLFEKQISANYATPHILSSKILEGQISLLVSDAWQATYLRKLKTE
jgi:hypothetical protein